MGDSRPLVRPFVRPMHSMPAVACRSPDSLAAELQFNTLIAAYGRTDERALELLVRLHLDCYPYGVNADQPRHPEPQRRTARQS